MSSHENQTALKKTGFQANLPKPMTFSLSIPWLLESSRQKTQWKLRLPSCSIWVNTCEWTTSAQRQFKTESHIKENEFKALVTSVSGSNLFKNSKKGNTLAFHFTASHQYNHAFLGWQNLQYKFGCRAKQIMFCIWFLGMFSLLGTMQGIQSGMKTSTVTASDHLKKWPGFDQMNYDYT